jgi:hypothetical protein
VKPLNFLSSVVEVTSLSALALLLPVTPFGYAVLSGRLSYVRDYGETVKRSARYLGALWRLRVISRNLYRTLENAPQDHERIEGSCTHCGLCCVDRTCLFLGWDGQGKSHCTIYDNWFWKLTPCGSYPVDRASIEVYGCASFKAVPIRIVPAKIAVAGPSPAFKASSLKIADRKTPAQGR